MKAKRQESDETTWKHREIVLGLIIGLIIGLAIPLAQDYAFGAPLPSPSPAEEAPSYGNL